MARNPYEDTPSVSTHNAMGPNSAFIVPPDGTDARSGATQDWAPRIGGTFAAGTDAHRLGTYPRHDMRPDAKHSRDQHYRPLDADEALRHSVEDIDTDGFTERKGFHGLAPDARRTPVGESRPMQAQSPTTWSFTRPFDRRFARQFNGMHFSMADHRRNYEIHGQAPVRTARNTYRIMPEPWDRNVVDLPPMGDGVPQGRITSIDVAPARNNSFRTGG